MICSLVFILFIQLQGYSTCSCRAQMTETTKPISNVIDCIAMYVRLVRPRKVKTAKRLAFNDMLYLKSY